MNKKIILASLGLTTLLACQPIETREGSIQFGDQYVHATVIEESGTIVERQKIIEASRGAIFGNESVRFGDPTYAIKFKTDKGNVYTFTVNESYQKKLEALNLAIQPGTHISIAKGDFYRNLNGTVGSIDDYDLKVDP